MPCALTVYKKYYGSFKQSQVPTWPSYNGLATISSYSKYINSTTALTSALILTRGWKLYAEASSYRKTLEPLCNFMSRRVKNLNTLDLLNVALYDTDRNWCQSEEEELSFKAMYQLFLENKLFQVQVLKHLELTLLSRVYETCLSALWKISRITSLLELRFCCLKEIVGFDQLRFPKEKLFFVCTAENRI